MRTTIYMRKVRCMRLRCATKLHLSSLLIFNLTSLIYLQVHLIYHKAIMRYQATYCGVQQNLYWWSSCSIHCVLKSYTSTWTRGLGQELQFIFRLPKDLLHIVTSSYLTFNDSGFGFRFIMILRKYLLHIAIHTSHLYARGSRL